MKKNIILTVAAVLLAVFAGVFFIVLNGEEKLSYVDYAECGVSLPISSDYMQKGLGIQAYGSDVSAYPTLYAYFQYTPALEKLDAEMQKIAEDEMTQEIFDDFMTKAMQHTKQLAAIYLVKDEEYDSFVKQGFDGDKEFFKDKKRIGKHGGYTYLAGYAQNTTDGMEAEELDFYNACSAAVKTAFKKAKFIDVMNADVQAANAAMLPPLPNFVSYDTEGNEVTNDILTKADVTVINVWGTFCGPCISEMPELAAWAESLPPNAQLIGIVSDVTSRDDTDGIADAQAILDKAGVKFTNILAGGDFQPFLANVQFVPTTFLVDKGGNVIGSPMVGANVDNYKKAVDEYLASK